MSLNVVLLGYGAIGKSLHQMLEAHPGRINVLGVVGRNSASDDHVLAQTRQTSTGLSVLGLNQALEGADIIAECASPAAVTELGPRIITSGTDLLVASLGALVDEQVRSNIMDAGPGRAYLSTGAIGGLDLIRAAGDTIKAITLRTSKHPYGLLHPGLDEATRDSITEVVELGDSRIVFEGTVADAVTLFPSNINVAAALGLAAGNFDLVRVRIVADPSAELTRHTIAVRGSGGSYDFDIQNIPDPHNPATSVLTARSMASGLLRLAGVGPHFI
ncbi:aspartate dehydrogenase domain-containing protein [Arthrobacter sp. MYb227]|uniref:aspartate dehydrogenase domain-containing protein n=1 Tax=Arthrobacter sp. MYb227 TaxID=1848601 RepID=UPI0015E3898D|nr:aspartate dehydrogenase domain-containing protein [Arthrobacter sp. MYb227]